MGVCFPSEIDRSVDPTVLRVEDVAEQQASGIIARSTDDDFSPIDAISFAAMERLGIDSAFASDGHFARYTYPLVAR